MKIMLVVTKAIVAGKEINYAREISLEALGGYTQDQVKDQLLYAALGVEPPTEEDEEDDDQMNLYNTLQIEAPRRGRPPKNR